MHEPRSNKIIVNRSPERENPIAASARARGDPDYQPEYFQSTAAAVNPFNTNFIGPQAHQTTRSFFGMGSGGVAITPRQRQNADEDFEIKPRDIYGQPNSNEKQSPIRVINRARPDHPAG